MPNSTRCCAGTRRWASTWPWTTPRTIASRNSPPRPLGRGRRRRRARATGAAQGAIAPALMREPVRARSPPAPRTSSGRAGGGGRRQTLEDCAPPWTLRGLRAQALRFAARVRGRQSAGPHHGGGRGSWRRRGPGGPPLRRSRRAPARSHAGRHRARPREGLSRQCRAMAPARKPQADRAGNGHVPALREAPDRTRRARLSRLPRGGGDAGAARRQGPHHQGEGPGLRVRACRRAATSAPSPCCTPTTCCASREARHTHGPTFAR